MLLLRLLIWFPTSFEKKIFLMIFGNAVGHHCTMTAPLLHRDRGVRSAYDTCS